MNQMLRRFVLPLFAALLLSGSTPAWAGHDTAVEIQFWSFSRDGRLVLPVVKDLARGYSTLAIKAVGNYAASVYEQQLPPETTPEQLPAYLMYLPFNAYGFVDGGAVGEASPDGYMIMAGKMGFELQVMFGKGEKVVKAFALPLAVSPDRTMVGEAKLKEVRWSSTGKAVALIVHHSLGGEYGLENDQLISFDPTPYKAKVAGPAAPPPAGKK